MLHTLHWSKKFLINSLLTCRWYCIPHPVHTRAQFCTSSPIQPEKCETTGKWRSHRFRCDFVKLPCEGWGPVSPVAFYLFYIGIDKNTTIATESHHDWKHEIHLHPPLWEGPSYLNRQGKPDSFHFDQANGGAPGQSWKKYSTTEKYLKLPIFHRFLNEQCPKHYYSVTDWWLYTPGHVVDELVEAKQLIAVEIVGGHIDLVLARLREKLCNTSDAVLTSA